jgi:hypothetical protein
VLPTPFGPKFGDLELASIAGDCRAECGFGGGRINPSESGSGDIESDELPYAPLPNLTLAGEVGDIPLFACISNSSLTSLGGITELNPDLRFCLGFCIGLCATLRLAPRVLADDLRVLRG